MLTSYQTKLLQIQKLQLINLDFLSFWKKSMA